jgi:hypothetical protein
LQREHFADSELTFAKDNLLSSTLALAEDFLMSKKLDVANVVKPLMLVT